MDAGLLETLKNVKLTSHKRRCTDNDFVDRVNCFYTPMLITIFTIVICTKSYIVGTPLQCWVPMEFSKGWEEFAESYCYIKNTYYVPRGQELPNDLSERKETEIQYYQWVPFILGLQSILFLIPSIFWKFTNWQGRLHIKPLVERSVVSSFESGVTKESTLRSVAEHIKWSLFKISAPKSHGALRVSILETRNKTCFGFMNAGYYLTFCYFGTKILYIVNIFLQFLIVRSFLNVDLSYGSSLLHKLVNGSDWQSTGVFPRVTLCDFSTNQLGQPISYTIQCVLVINLFNEKIYIFLWFWFLFLMVITVGSLIMWTFKMLFSRQLTTFLPNKSEYKTNVHRNLELVRCQKETTTDVFFVLRMIEENCGVFTARKVVKFLIDFYKESAVNNGSISPPPDYQEAISK